MRARSIVLGALATGVALGTGCVAARGSVPRLEERCFRVANDAPDGLYPIVWPVMQIGSLAAVFATALDVNRRRDARSAATVAVIGTSVWAGVKLVKPFIGRGRPADMLSDVSVRGAPQRGLGYPSGHAAVSMTLALIAGQDGWARRRAFAAAGVTALSRMYVGAHLPLDVVGGVAIGAAIGTLSEA